MLLPWARLRLQSSYLCLLVAGIMDGERPRKFYIEFSVNTYYKCMVLPVQERGTTIEKIVCDSKHHFSVHLHI
jgi:hypothetical protein